MATATQLLPTEASITIHTGTPTDIVHMDEAIHLATLCKKSLNDLSIHLPNINHSHPYTADEILALPLSKHRIDDALHDLPRRKSQRHQLAVAIASLLYPVHEGSLTSIIRYEADRVRLRGWAALQRKYDMLEATKRNGHSTQGMTGGAAPGVQAPVWAGRITAQGPWDPAKHPISLDGVQAIPMPVHIAQEEDLAPFLGHLQNGGTHELKGDEQGSELDGGRGEPYYGVKGAEFTKGVVYEDGRMDLCKMVVGPDHIGKLMDSLRPNEFVRHFLLGNNIIGPVGAREVADFIEELPNRMDTWYLAGNCIDGPSFEKLVDAMVKSEAITNVWLKRNPLGADASEDVFRLITGVKNLRTLDLDQTQLGNRGVADLFTRLAAHRMPEGTKLPLENIYLNGNGISTEAAKAIASFLTSPHCGLHSLYISSNPLGDDGAEALAAALPKAPYLARLFLQSVGVSTKGAVALCKAATGHPSLQAFDLGQAFATQDLGQAYNYIEDAAVPAIAKLLMANSTLAYFNLGHCALTPPGVIELSVAVCQSPSLLYYTATSILPDLTLAPVTFTPSQDLRLANPAQRTRPQIASDKAVREHLEANVRARYGADATYARFLEEDKRWIVNDRTDVRKIDSVYRNRDAGLARRRLMTLVKNWEEGDDTLERVMKAQGAPSCSLRRR
ncbi:Fc.00g016200.m01.CDS01 [Cosmosporella sp. VM-42]